jgi:hypothetical protein
MANAMPKRWSERGGGGGGRSRWGLLLALLVTAMIAFVVLR